MRIKIGNKVKWQVGDSKGEGQVYNLIPVEIKEVIKKKSVYFVDCKLVSGQIPKGHHPFKIKRDEDTLYVFRVKEK